MSNQVEPCGCVNFSKNGLIAKYCKKHLAESIHRTTMTPLNTIIEEEKNRARALANETIDDYHKEQAHIFTNPALDTFITTATQRAYEAGREENP